MISFEGTLDARVRAAVANCLKYIIRLRLAREARREGSGGKMSFAELLAFAKIVADAHMRPVCRVVHISTQSACYTPYISVEDNKRCTS